ncbi:hypothetical protein [Streptomyces pakalii]|uniref:Beta/Gamma crystallin n=1 Tax=Streptomyces pakalii TaxID=3036494 RepID=A0ABT7DHY5_9ACTN|nr:hypothetical protein [Streptomyces pakalii]MDJ1645431.1 hypothetical protein [Streptomyces pakalii]
MFPFRNFLVAGAVLTGTVVLAQPTSARPLGPSTSPQSEQAPVTWHAFSETDWQGLDIFFSGEVGECKPIPSTWNDRIRSARTEVPTRRVELWEDEGCSGTSIVIDGSGYSDIGPWVSSYRVAGT